MFVLNANDHFAKKWTFCLFPFLGNVNIEFMRCGLLLWR